MAVLTLAVPSKGRLKEDVEAYFADAGVVLSQTSGSRGYRATLAGYPDIEVMLLSASEIASSLIAGDIHIGITGHDLLLEQLPELDRSVHLIQPLGFGRADVVVAVPEYWIDVLTMVDLDDVCADFARKYNRRIRVATKYDNLTRRHFEKWRIGDYRIVESAGATEAAPATGTAEIIVDITSTGSTLKANGLKTLSDGTILQSEALLAASLKAQWTADARAAAAALLDRLSARDRARTSQILRVPLGKDADATLAVLEKETKTVLLSRPTEAGGQYALLCPRANLNQAIALLRAKGCTAPVVSQDVGDVHYVFDNANPFYAELSAALG